MLPFESFEELEGWVMAEVKKAFPTVHILKSGYPMCEFSLALATQWPAGNSWVSFLDPNVKERVTCEFCKAEHSAIRPS
jgi:hypothetical protein